MFAFKHSCRSQQRIHRHHAGATDASHIHRIAVAARNFVAGLLEDGGDIGQHWFGALREPIDEVDGHKRWAIAVETRVIFVTRGLMDAGLAAELGVDRLHR